MSEGIAPSPSDLLKPGFGADEDAASVLEPEYPRDGRHDRGHNCN